MEYAIIALAIAIIVVLLVCEKNVCDKVCSSSRKIAELQELNEQTKFHPITNQFHVYKRYDNKSNYNKIEPAYLMTADIRSKIAFFSDYIAKIQENRNTNIQYQTAVQDLRIKEYIVDYDELKLSEWIYKWHEEKLFSKKVVLPIVSCEYTVSMSYSSPKGKVNLSKRAVFNFEDVFACFESVSRTYLDKKTHAQLSAVERGYVSDSLRYDILNRDNFACVICGASSKQGARLHVDHIIPVSKGGKSIPSNLRTLCERCNIGKSNKIERAAVQPVSFAPDDLVCEKCGAKLILRTATRGTNAGNQFYGCPNYPRCKYIRNI